MAMTVQQLIYNYKGTRKEKKEEAFANTHIWDEAPIYGFVIKALQYGQEFGWFDDESIRKFVKNFHLAMESCTIDDAEKIFNEWAKNEDDVPDTYIR